MPAAKALLDSLGQRQIYQWLTESTGGQRSNCRKQAGAKQHWKKGTPGSLASDMWEKSDPHPPLLQDTLQPFMLC